MKNDLTQSKKLEEVAVHLSDINTQYGKDAVLLSSMQYSSCLLMYLLHTINADIRVLFVDTGFHFPETLALRDTYAQKYGLTIITATPALTPAEQLTTYGSELYNSIEGQPLCCRMRKKVPFLKTVTRLGIKAIVSGLHEEGGARSDIPAVGFDSYAEIPKHYPLHNWTDSEIEQATHKFDLPTHPLYQQSYLSIGCVPCTTPVAPGEPKRAGRWRHLNGDKQSSADTVQYCEINCLDKKKKGGK